jgi:NADPH:quinone reductase-like Zn-dependent oxidoreductase
VPRSLALRCHRLADGLAGVSLVPLDAVPPAAGEVAVSMRAAALNFPDLLMTRGGYQHKPALPFTIGMEGAGTVEAASRSTGPSSMMKMLGTTVCPLMISARLSISCCKAAPSSTGWTSDLNAFENEPFTI